MFMMMSLGIAQDYRAGAIKVSKVWTREMPSGSKVGGGYMTITNTGTEPDTLVGGSVVGAANFEVHQMETVGGVMKMRELKPGLTIKPGETAVLEPGSSHAMFVGLTTRPKAGQSLKGTLFFEKAGKIDVEYKVEPLGARMSGSGSEISKGTSGHEHD
jgi:copper(I)-binding protein